MKLRQAVVVCRTCRSKETTTVVSLKGVVVVVVSGRGPEMAETEVHEATVGLYRVALLSAARKAVVTWLEPGRRGHAEAMGVLGRVLIALCEQGEDGGHA